MSAKARVAVIAVIAVGLGWGGVAWMRADDARPEKPTIVVKTGTLDETASLTGADRADVVAQVRGAGGGDAGEKTRGAHDADEESCRLSAAAR